MRIARSTVPSTGWTNWIAFAAVILLVNGVFSITEALVALIGPDTYYAVVDGSLLLFDVQGWGWWNLIVGILQLATALAILRGATWGRVVGVILAILSALIHMLLIPVQPWWSFIVIALDVLIICALIAHGDEFRVKK